MYVIIAEYLDNYCGMYDVVGCYTSKQTADWVVNIFNLDNEYRLKREGLSGKWQPKLYVVHETRFCDSEAIQSEEEYNKAIAEIHSKYA